MEKDLCLPDPSEVPPPVTKSTPRITFRRLAIASHLLTEKSIKDPFVQPVYLRVHAIFLPTFFAITQHEHNR